MNSTLLLSAAPLAAAALGGLFSDLSGSLAVFLEGFMILGSFLAWSFSYFTGSIGVGVLLAVGISAGLAWLLGRFVQISGANPFIAGVAMNLAAAGLCDLLSMLWFGTKGVLQNAVVRSPASVKLPFLEDIPYLGPLLSDLSPFVYVVFFLYCISAFVLHRTRIGLRLNAAGRAPDVLLERGCNPAAYREGAWAVAAALAALGGAILSFRVGAYAPGGIAGRGWIALAAVYLGFRKVWGVAVAALLFAWAERLAGAVQGASFIPSSLALGFPSLIALVLFSVSQAFQKYKNRRTPC